MEKIKLSKGLIAIGGNEKSGKTSFSILLANKIAKKEKVLFLNWKDYADRLHQIIRNNGEIVNNFLDINTNIEYFSVGSFIKIMELIDINKYSFIFIDDINYFTQTGNLFSELDQYNTYGKNSAIRALRFIVDKFKVNVIFNIEIDTNETPQLADFAWSRLIINECDQVLAINENDKNKIEVYNLKKQNLEIENHQIKI